MSNAHDRSIALPPLAFRIGVTGAARLDEAAKDRLRPQVAAVLDRVKAELEAPAAEKRAAAVYAPGADSRPQPELRLVSLLGAGADRLVAEEALRLGYRLDAPLPFAQAAYEATFLDSVAEFRALLRAARPRTLILDGDTADDIVRWRSYGEVGRLVVRNCDLLIAIWDDNRPPKGPGGTADTVRFAVHTGVPVWWLHADGAHEPALLTDVLHLAQPQDAPSGEAALNAWLRQHLRDTILPPEPPQPQQHGMLGRLAHWLQSWFDIPGDPLCVFLAEVERENHLLWKAHDWILGPPRRGRAKASTGGQELPSHPAARLARFYQARYRSSYVYVFALAAVALVCAVLGLAFEAAEAVTAPVELAALLGIFVLVLANLVLPWHDRYMSYRLLTELFRLQRRLATLGWSLPPLQVSGLAVRSGSSWVHWYFAAVVRATELQQGILTGEQLRAAQHGVEGLLDEQIHFHKRRKDWKERRGRALERWGEGLFVLTLAFVALKAILLQTELGHGAAPSLSLVAALLPAASAAFFGVRAYEETEVLAEQSERMLEALRAAKERINAIRLDRPLASQLLAAEMFEVASLMLADVNGWAQLFRMKAVGAG